MRPEFSVKILGSGSAAPSKDNYPSSQIVRFNNQLYLIDCGEGCQKQIINNKVGFSGIKHIFISHLHGDHYFGLFGLLSSMNLLGRKTGLHIYANEKLKSIITYLFLQGGDRLNFPLYFHKLEYNGMEKILHTKSLDVYSFPLKHRIPTCGFLFNEKINTKNIKKEVIEKYDLNYLEIRRIKQGADLVRNNRVIANNDQLCYETHKPRSYAYCSDTGYYPPLVEYLNQVDMLYHEATYTNEMTNNAETYYHSTAAQAAKIASESGAGRLLIGHFSARYKEELPIINEAKKIFRNTIHAIENEKYIL